MSTPRVGSLGVLSATGNMRYRDSLGDVTEVSTAGQSDGQVLTLSGGVPVWDDAPGDSSTLFFGITANAGTTFGDYVLIDVGSNSDFNMNVSFPNDFGAIVEMVLVGIADFTGNADNIDFTSQYGGLGEQFPGPAPE